MTFLGNPALIKLVFLTWLVSRIPNSFVETQSYFCVTTSGFGQELSKPHIYCSRQTLGKTTWSIGESSYYPDIHSYWQFVFTNYYPDCLNYLQFLKLGQIMAHFPLFTNCRQTSWKMGIFAIIEQFGQLTLL